MTRKRIIVILAVLILCAALFYFYAGGQTPQGQPPLANLTPQNFTAIESAFNAAKDNVRVLLLLSPT